MRWNRTKMFSKNQTKVNFLNFIILSHSLMSRLIFRPPTFFQGVFWLHLSCAPFILAIYSGFATFNQIRLEKRSEFKNSFKKFRKLSDHWPKPDRRNMNEELSTCQARTIMHYLNYGRCMNFILTLRSQRMYGVYFHVFEIIGSPRTHALRDIVSYVRVSYVRLLLRTKMYNPRALLDIYGFSSRVLTSMVQRFTKERVQKILSPTYEEIQTSPDDDVFWLICVVCPSRPSLLAFLRMPQNSSFLAFFIWPNIQRRICMNYIFCIHSSFIAYHNGIVQRTSVKRMRICDVHSTYHPSKSLLII